MIWRARDREWDLSRRSLIMGILNVTPDSFSDGGRYRDRGMAVDHALKMIDEGADIIDIGGESTRPGAPEIPVDDEILRVLPVIESLRKHHSDIAISVDTSKALVAQQAMDAGADIINDVTGLTGDPKMARVAARTRAGLVIMHMQGNPRTMQRSPRYPQGVAKHIRDFLAGQIRAAAEAGIPVDRLALDPGIGFGKTLAHNCEILRRLEVAFRDLDRPLLLGASRKSFIGAILNTSDLSDRHWPTVALTALAIERGARILRVHAVRDNVHAARMTEAILDG